MLEEVKEFNSSQSHHANHHHQFDRDQFIATQLEKIGGKAFGLAVYKNYELIFNLFPYATQKLGSPEMHTKAHQADITAAWLLPIRRPDDKRHALNKEHHLHSHLEHDIYQFEQPQSAVAGVWNFGVHHETGHPDRLSPQLGEKGKYKESELEKPCWKQFKDNFQYGAMGAPTLVSKFILRGLDSHIHDAYQSIVEGIWPEHRFDTLRDGAEIFMYRAQVFNLHTQSHVDQGDYRGGLACLSYSGDYSGEFLGQHFLKRMRKLTHSRQTATIDA